MLYHSRKPDYQKILKLAEPNLNPEMKANDYTVHFPHQSYREPVVKDFKVSGPVSPDSIRYQLVSITNTTCDFFLNAYGRQYFIIMIEVLSRFNN